ncbi:MAG: radical SAM protein [Paludibacteraceae bacterium]|nr:radical SAM protein [Paludibacteraceae bacterium]
MGIWLLHILNKRYMVVFFDPVLGCNLRCKMCYFSNEVKRKEMKGNFNPEDLPRVAEVIFKQALKLQIGCGAEPTLYKHNVEIISLAKQFKVPYISFTTNANLLTKEEIYRLLEAGLNEFTISLHGVEKSTYENLMQQASYDKFIEVMQLLTEAKKQYPHFNIRVNYTVNELNLVELNHFFDVYDSFAIDILQVRPLQDIGGVINHIEKQQEFNHQFNKITAILRDICKSRNITYIAPIILDEKAKENTSSSVVESTYCYISPKSFWDSDMDWRNETFRQFSKRTGYASILFKRIYSKKELTNTKLNYDIN